MTPLDIFTTLLTRLEKIGGEITVANLTPHSGFYIAVNHPDINIDLRGGDATVQIRCRKGMFPPTRAHVDVDDIMTVIEGWMKEAGGKCGAKEYGEDKTLSSGNWSAPMSGTEPAARVALRNKIIDEELTKYESALASGKHYPTPRSYRGKPSAETERRAELLAKKRREWGVDKPPPQHPAALRGYHTTSGNPYCVVTRGTGGTEEHWLHALADALWMVREAKSDSRITHIELTDHRPGGKEWYYDRDRSGFWKRTVHN